MTEKFPDAQIKMIKGRGGIFDVTYEGQLVFSKHRQGRFPDSREVIDAVEERIQ
ncbi:Rdx family protein [bacterium]|nr:Rdx family protein [bacterium]